jgi:[protein-PII] uridylyltransferase
MLTTADQPRSGSMTLFDAPALAADLERLGASHSGRERDLRGAIVQRLRTTLAEGRAKAERMLLEDRHGRRCAERLCFMHDEIIRVLYEFAEKRLYPAHSRSEAERMAVVATGGYGRGLLAPGSDIDLLFVLPYKQTAWGESVAETIL